MRNRYSSSNLQLHLDAEKRLTKLATFSDVKLPEYDLLKHYHELQIYQIELDMQNEELAIQQKKGEVQTVELKQTKKKLAVLYQEFDKQTLQLKKMEEIEQINNCFIGRELKMIELKKEINELLQKEGQEEKYVIY